MKKAFQLLQILVLAFSVCSCNKEVINSSSANHSSILHFQAVETIRESKAFFGDQAVLGHPVLWEDTDAASVTVNYGATPVHADITPSDNGRTGLFTAALDTPGSGSFSVQAVVPETALVQYNTSYQNVTLSIPASQTPLSSSPDASSIQLVASEELADAPSSEETIRLPFHHATAYGCLTLTNLPTNAAVQAIDLVFSVPVTGKWIYDPSSGSMTPDVPSNIITLHTDKSANVFFGCAPADLQGQTLKVRLYTESGIYEHSFSITGAYAFQSGKLARFTVNMSGATKKTSISVLALGHSYAQDTYWNLYQPLVEMGYTDIVLGVMYKANCSLQEHVSFYTAGSGYQNYWRNTSGNWVNNSPVLSTVLNEREWDYITIQQSVEGQGQPATFDPYLNQIIDIVRSHRPTSKLIWNMLWAFESGYTNEERFAPYNFDQITMYNAIISTTRGTVLSTGAFGDVVPCGTAVQNLRTSFFGDHICRDKYHMSYREGRFVTALMMCRQFTRESIMDITFTPSGYSYSEQDVAAIKEAVESAFIAPFHITQYGTPADPSEPEPDPDGISCTFSEAIDWTLPCVFAETIDWTISD